MGKKHQKIFHKNNQRKLNRSNELKENIKGFLIMSDKNKEKGALTDAYDLLNEQVGILYPSLIENQKIFFNFDTGCNGVVFVKLDKSVSNIVDVYKINNQIFNKIKEEKRVLSKYILKLFPIEICTLFSIEHISENLKAVFDKRFNLKEDENIKHTIDIEIRYRNNSKAKKEEIMDKVLNSIDFNHFELEYTNPEYTVFIDITCELMCISILDKYHENKGYNTHILGKTEDEIKAINSVKHDKVVVKNRQTESDDDNNSVNLI